MAKELFLLNAKFGATVQELDHVLQALPLEYRPTWTLREAILDPREPHKIGDAASALFTAIQIGIVTVLKSWGVRASAVVGFSTGEIAAAYAAGLLDQSEAIIVAHMISHSVAQLRPEGAMAAASIDAQSAEKLIEQSGLKGEVCVSAINAPKSILLSGSIKGVEVMISELKKQKKPCLKLNTGGVAYHSHMMEDVTPYYETLIAPYIRGKRETTRNSDVKMFSSVGHSGEDLPLLGKDTDMIRYWRDNIEKPVQFNAALLNLAASEDFHFIGIGPHHALSGPIHPILTAASGPNKPPLPYKPSLIKGQDSDLVLKKLAGSLFLHGHELDWGKVNDFPDSVSLQTSSDDSSYSWLDSGAFLWS
ncbi:acyl transferase/acyl hydrolase/lysophospholipase [Annulohypoxylon moriforme]|nr:acyl transferase/acyl hydrolase/lysophospholipase [Annulohypoxylon moriforme]